MLKKQKPLSKQGINLHNLATLFALSALKA
jgi:hypothetical protein